MQKHLILLHGALADESQLFFIRDALREHAVVHTYTFSGHGKDSNRNGALSMDEMAREVKELADAIGLAPDIFGYSMGGYAALCATLLTDCIGKVVTLGTKFDWNAASASREVQFLNPEIMANKIPLFTSALEQIHGPNWKTLVHKTAAMMLDLANTAPLDAQRLKRITNKVMILVGDQDVTAGVDASRKAAMLLTNSEFFVLNKSQHPIEKTNPVELTNRIRLFLYDVT